MPTKSAAKPSARADEWISLRYAAEIIGVQSYYPVFKGVMDGHVAVQELPGHTRKYRKRDIEQFARERIRRLKAQAERRSKRGSKRATSE